MCIYVYVYMHIYVNIQNLLMVNLKSQHNFFPWTLKVAFSLSSQKLNSKKGKKKTNSQVNSRARDSRPPWTNIDHQFSVNCLSLCVQAWMEPWLSNCLS